MPRAPGGTYTAPFQFVNGTAADANQVNDRFNDVGTALTGSLSRQGLGGMLAPLGLTDGAINAPSLTFNNENSLGLFRSGNNEVSIIATATKLLTVNLAYVRSLVPFQSYRSAMFTTDQTTAPAGTFVTSGTGQPGVLSSGGPGGAGIRGVGGTGGTGVRGEGIGSGDGVTGLGGLTGRGGFFQGGATGADAVRAVAGTNGAGIRADGNGSGDAVVGTGGTTGRGGLFVGGTTSGDGIRAMAMGSLATGVSAKGGPGGIGVVSEPGTAATSAAPMPAVRAVSGYYQFVSAPAPLPTTNVKGYITPSSVVTTSATILVNDNGTVTLSKGLNVASVAPATGDTIRVTFAAPYDDTNYTITGATMNGRIVAIQTPLNLAFVDIQVFNPLTATPIVLAGSGVYNVYIHITG